MSIRQIDSEGLLHSKYNCRNSHWESKILRAKYWTKQSLSNATFTGKRLIKTRIKKFLTNILTEPVKRSIEY